MLRLKSDPGNIDRWLARNEVKRRPLVVLLGGSVNSLSFARSLGRRGVPTLLLESHDDVVMRSRFGATSILPDVDVAAPEWLHMLEYIGRRLGQPGVVFAPSDSHLLFLSKYRAEVGRYFRLLLPPAGVIERIVNKREQYAVACSAGIPLPKTIYPHSMADVRAGAAEMGFPCIVKPYSYSGRKTLGNQKAAIVTSPAELIAQCSMLGERLQGFLIQEVVPGPKSAIFAYHGFWDHEGNERAWWTKQHLRGSQFYGSFHISVDAPEVASLSRRLLSAFAYRGFSHVEFKLDSRDHTYRLMEINARTGQSNQHGIAAGVDLPWLAYRYLTEGAESDVSCPPFRRGITYVHERQDLQCFLELRRKDSIRLLPWAMSVVKAPAKVFWAWDDPGPFFALAWKYVTARKLAPAQWAAGSPERVVIRSAMHSERP
jgi:D-aspartate ligase